jgi:hypothetical protein
MRVRALAASLALGACVASMGANAFFVNDTHPGGRLSMNIELPTDILDLGVGAKSWAQVMRDAMGVWNTIGIGTGLDHSFFASRSPVVPGDACNGDNVNDVRFGMDQCGMAWGTTLAVTITRSQGSIVRETDVSFDSNRTWGAYLGPLQRDASGSGTVFDFRRVAIHELGHAAGLGHPDDHAQTVSSIMNSRTSNVDSPTPDDVAGAHAIQWTTSSATTPPPPTADAHLATIGTRATVSPGATVFGGFTIAPVSGVARQSVYILVRGPSLAALGVTTNPLDLPGLRVFDSQGRDVLTNASGGTGISTCPASSTVATYYRIVRGQAPSDRDACVQVDLAAGVYTFSIAGTSAGASGEVLFEVLFNAQPLAGKAAGASLNTIGSRGTVAALRTLYGGFTLDQSGTVMIAVRGTSLTTLGVATNGLGNPGLRLYDSAGRDLLKNTNGGVTVSSCSATNTTAQYYANTRGQPLSPSDACLFPRTLAAGVYTFTIDPSLAETSGQVLFEVTFSH